MPFSLHTEKIKDERTAFVNELYSTIISKDSLINGSNSGQALRLHKLYLCLYIMNHYKAFECKSPYYDYLFSSLIESESLFLLGIRNAAMMSLRTTLELAFKFVFFEYHPIELELNEKSQFDMHAIEYRNFLYTIPAFSAQSVIKKDDIELLWRELCQYTHYDSKVIDSISVISEITSIFVDETTFQSCIAKVKGAIRFIFVILFLVNPQWLKDVEKSYFDYPFEILFNSEEAIELKIKLHIE